MDQVVSKRPPLDDYALDDQIAERLRTKQLPQMVDWYDPTLLAAVGIRELVSGTMGAYADQRQMQAATDQFNPEREHDLAHRYDYSGQRCSSTLCNGQHPKDDRAMDWGFKIPQSTPQPFWVDYIADLGDGFEATYAMAYLMASDTLEVKGCAKAEGLHLTEAGRLLIMGGDQCYPTATANEYRNRLLEPYNAAFASALPPKRKVFAIPGNHDWYDGLTAFDGVFCAARDRMSRGEGLKIGGWRSEQHRSYFAIKMPYNWWVWGPDIQLEGHLDDPQKDYFDLVSEHIGPDDKILICLAEPSWLHADYQNLREIVMIASKTGAKICAVLAGDWHHYSRYFAKDLGISFITCGGGGAFAHATHSLSRKLTLKWPVRTDAAHVMTDARDSYEHNVAEKRVAGGTDFQELDVGGSAVASDAETNHQPTSAADSADNAMMSRRSKRERDLIPLTSRSLDQAHDCIAPHIYPKPIVSRLLSLKNVLFPFQHFKFAVGIGVIYWLISWVAFEIYQSNPAAKLIIPPPNEASVQTMLGDMVRSVTGSCDMLGTAACQPAAALSSNGHAASWHDLWITKVLQFLRVASTHSIAMTLMVLGLWIGLIKYVDVSWYRNWPKLITWPLKIAIGTAHTLAHIMAIAGLTYGVNFLIALIAYGTTNAEMSALSAVAQTDTAWKNSFLLAFSDWRLLGPPILIIIGGLLGGMVWGLYWAITCAFLNMHTGDAFGALALRHYKHFLRMKFEPDKVTVYPIKLDRVPGRKGWRARNSTDPQTPQTSRLVPKRPLKPALIEPPIEIYADDVWPRQTRRKPVRVQDPAEKSLQPSAADTSEDEAASIAPGIPG